MNTELEAIKRLECIEETPEELLDRAAELNEQADSINQRWSQLQADRSAALASGTDGILESAQSGGMLALFKAEQALLSERRQLHEEYLEFLKDYASAVRDILAKLGEATGEAREYVAMRLQEIGYKRRGEGAFQEQFERGWIEKHPAVRAAIAKRRQRGNEFDERKLTSLHQQAISQVDAALAELNRRVAEWSGLASESPQPEPAVIEQGRPLKESEAGMLPVIR